MILTILPAGGGLLRQGLILVEVQVLGTTVVPLLLQEPSRPRSQRRAANPFCTPSGVGQRIVILREVGRLKPNGFGRNADLCDCKS